MICFCRVLKRTFSANCKLNNLGAYLQSSAGVRNHARCFSLENHQILPEDKAISAQASVDMKKFEMIYKKTRTKANIAKFLDNCFLKNEFSPSYVVSFIRAACDECSCSQELVYTVLMTLNKFLKSNDIELALSPDQKSDILNSVLSYKYFQLVSLTCSVFKFDKTDQSIREFVQELVLKQKFVEAAYCIGALKLQHEFDMENIILSLLTQGKIGTILSCISDCPDAQLKTVQKLDSLLVIGKLKSSSNMSLKTIFKTLSSIVNHFKIPPEQCKNLHFIRGRAAINILLKKKYEQSVSESTFEEMVMSVIAKNPQLKEHLIYKLKLKKDMDTALKMVSKLDMQDFDISSLTCEKENTSDSTTESKIDDEEISDEKCDIADPDHLTFSLTASDIHFIDTKEKFFDCILDITQNYKIIGVDSEWKPHFGLAYDRLSLIQIAVHDKVYILDMISLNDCLETELWDRLIDDIFASPEIVKLGCGIMSDVQMIVESNKGSDGRVLRFSHILDLAIFYRKLQEVYPDNFVIQSDKNLLGLSKLSEIILGKTLNKEERLCDWEKRPLTESQLEYAALDAHCLLQMFDSLKQEANEKDLKFNHLSNVAMVLTSSLSKPKRKLRQFRNEKSFQIRNPIPIHKFKVVVDSELEHLGKELRQLGADVVILRDSDTHKTAIQISNSEKRVLICSESLWNLVQDQVSRKFCTKLPDDCMDEISASHILHKFNVQLKTKYILSRCLVCNSEEGIWLSPENVNVLEDWTTKNTPTPENDTEMNSFLKTLSEMDKAGIDIKFNPQTSPSSSSTTQTYLCTKCGAVQ